ncbi:putative methyltransferase domain containing protein [Naviculisporaceae sp. PSN 640]
MSDNEQPKSPSPKEQITRFCRQYLQLESSLDYPDNEVLIDETTQNALYSKLFSGDQPTPPRYQLKVLKELVARIESSITDWDEHGISDSLMDTLSVLLSTPLPAEISAAQQKSRVTYHLSLLDSDNTNQEQKENTITLLESRNLISASGTTGLRTWEAALHLGQYLCAYPSIIQGQRILELGAGTGYLGILCAKYLGAEHVLVSDGSDDVINNLPDSLFLNGLQIDGDSNGGNSKITPTQLLWGHALVGTEEEKWNGGRKIDVVLGADITYDASIIPSLVGTLEDLVGLYPDVKVLIAATERNRETFESFLDVCKKRGFEVDSQSFPVPKREDQQGPFYSDAAPIHICLLGHRSR